MTGSSAWESGSRQLWAIGLAAALIVGIVLRLIWPNDIEFKADERWMFARAQNVGVTEPWPWLGMPSSATVSNPGLNVWLFAALRRLFQAADPPELARAVQVLNICAIAILVCFALSLVGEKEREPWLWAAALASVNPIAVLFQRKIWQPCVLPIFTIVLLIGWWRRDSYVGAFVWGLVGAVLGQIHGSGFFFAAAFALWTAIYQRSSVRWKAWFAGAVLGAVPMLPWLAYLHRESSQHTRFPGHFSHLFEFSFWTRWITEPFGLGLSYSLGNDYRNFLAGPIVAGARTWLVLLIHLLLVICAIVTFGRWLLMRSHDKRILDARNSSTGLALSASFIGFGVLLTLSTLPIHRWYLMASFPLEFVWLGRLALTPDGAARPRRSGRELLAVICALQAILSFCFLSYLHLNGGARHGDYGISYSAQLTNGTPFK
jgi:hypothetical protein